MYDANPQHDTCEIAVCNRPQGLIGGVTNGARRAHEQCTKSGKQVEIDADAKDTD